MNLRSPLSKAINTTRDHLDALKGMGIATVQDLLDYLPRSHEDLSAMQSVTTAALDEKVTISGTVEGLRLVRTKRGKQLVTAVFTDSEGESVDVIWFNQPHIKRMLRDGDNVVLTGKIIENGYKLQFQSPTFEKESSRELVHAGRLVPVYPQHDIINTKWLREKIALVKKCIDEIGETLPKNIATEHDLVSRAEMIRSFHFPESVEDVKRAKERLAFEKMFHMQHEVLSRKREWQGEKQERLKMPMNPDLIKSLFSSLKFTPTNSQKVAIYEILKDMERDVPMSRLLEGDVGSGKTLVATAVIAHTIAHGGQVALMVPTEVLAKQHVSSIGNMLIQFQKFLTANGDTATLPRHPTVALLTGSVPKGEADTVRMRVAAGTVDLVIGTHALITDSTQFHDLKLVIVDEQHRFGVEQRERLKAKGNPHFLTMTATPIPRTLALTAHGHHDLSVLLEKPGQRQTIDTKVVPPKDRKTVEHFIDSQIEEGRQIFVICPLISESDNEEMMEMKSVQTEAARLKEAFPHRRVTHLHGKMSSQEKDEMMRRFKDHEFDILVSTSVIEVGIDVPNATIIVIEGAERFGLSQLHQFRGRVGRSDLKSYCFLFPTNPKQSYSPRLKAMEKHDSGFLLAEIDLQLRGPGELFGLRQSGIAEGSIGDLLNPELVVKARRAAEAFLGANV